MIKLAMVVARVSRNPGGGVLSRLSRRNGDAICRRSYSGQPHRQRHLPGISQQECPPCDPARFSAPQRMGGSHQRQAPARLREYPTRIIVEASKTSDGPTITGGPAAAAMLASHGRSRT